MSQREVIYRIVHLSSAADKYCDQFYCARNESTRVAQLAKFKRDHFRTECGRTAAPLCYLCSTYGRSYPELFLQVCKYSFLVFFQKLRKT